MTIFFQYRLPAFIILCVVVGTTSGCDFGTYAQRAADSSKGFEPPAIAKPASPAKNEN